MTIPLTYPVYPFSALVGQERLKRALILNAINTRIGGVLIRGEKGTAKSTAVRGLARLLPPIAIVRGCPYHCHPEQPSHLCSVCTTRQTDQPLPIVEQPTHLIELPVSASEDRVVGSLDLEHAITEGQRRFEPGILAQVNRGLLYVDEVNLLDDHLVDVLLDAAAMGLNTVEREGISVSHPARFILVGTMNPEEGELRPQLLDRFGLAVEISGLTDAANRIAIMERRLAYDADPEQFVAQWGPEEQKISQRIIDARTILPQVRISKQDMHTVANLSLELEVDGHRADLTILETARTHAAWEGRTELQQRDIQLAAELALPHRLRRQPFAEVQIDRDHIGSAIERSSPKPETQTNQTDHGEKKTNVSEHDMTEAAPNAEWDGSHATVGKASTSEQRNNQHTDDTNTGTMVFEIHDIFRPRRIEGQQDRKYRKASGRRSQTYSSRKQGRYITSQRKQPVTDLAFDATLREAAPYQRARREMMQSAQQSTPSPHPTNALNIAAIPPDSITTTLHQQPTRPPAIILYRDDLRQKIRTRRTRNAVCFVVDASWSMAAEERMYATKTAVLSLLRDAYQRRDYVGLVSFQRTEAHILLPLTNSVELAQKCLQTMPVGGKTPLTHGLLTGYEMLERARRQNHEVIPLLVIITDGHANVAMGGHLLPQVEAYQIAEYIARSNIRSIVIDTEYSSTDKSHALSSTVSAHASPRWNTVYTSLEHGLARHLANSLQAAYHRLEDLGEESLAQTVRTQMYP